MGIDLWSDFIPTYTLRDETLYVSTPSGEIVPVEKIGHDQYFRATQELFVHYSGAQYISTLDETLTVRVRPTFDRVLRYQAGPCEGVEDIYPPSTGAWFLRMARGAEPAHFITLDIKGSTQKWMVILRPESDEIAEAHRVEPYEAEALIPSSGYLSPVRHHRTYDVAKRNKTLSDLLDVPSAPLTDIINLIGKANIPSVRHSGYKPGATMRESLDPLIPDWPNEVREPTMAFLSFILQNPGPIKKDTVEFCLSFSPELNILGHLIRRHQIQVLGNRPVPPYLQLFWAYEMSDQKDSLVAIPPRMAFDQAASRPNVIGIVLGWHGSDLREEFRAVRDSVVALQKSGRLMIGLPITKQVARKSREADLQRTLMSSGGAGLRAAIDMEALGLSRIYYIGRAYRWPHRHLAWQATLSGGGDRPLMVHEVVAPPSAYEAIRRVIPMMRADWHARSRDVRMASGPFLEYEGDIDEVAGALDNRVSERVFKRRNRIEDSKPYTDLTDDDITILDWASGVIYLDDLEVMEISTSLGLTQEEVHSSLKNFVEAGVITPMYNLSLATRAVFVLGRGNLENMLSLANAMRKNCVGSMAAKLDDGASTLVIGSFPPSHAEGVRDAIIAKGQELGLDLLCYSQHRIMSFRNRLFGRLWKGDGWDDEVSGLLSQARSTQTPKTSKTSKITK